MSWLPVDRTCIMSSASIRGLPLRKSTSCSLIKSRCLDGCISYSLSNLRSISENASITYILREKFTEFWLLNSSRYLQLVSKYRCKDIWNPDGFSTHGGMQGVKFITILLRLISESTMVWFNLIPSVGMVFGLASNRRRKPVPITLLKAGLHGFDRRLQIYCKHHYWRRSLRGISPASIYM